MKRGFFRCYRVLAAPSRRELHRALREAGTAANKGCRSRTLDWTSARTSALLRKSAIKPEGVQQWRSDGEPKRSKSMRATVSVIAVAWWTDRIGRIHYRIASARLPCASAGADDLFHEAKGRPILWLVYPEDLYLHQTDADSQLFAVCHCGMAGPPEAIGWMGPQCAACHDRTEAGEPIPCLAGTPRRRMLLDPSWPAFVAFAPNNRALSHGT